MVEVTASMVKELREMTGLGMMECKKALAETNGDIKAAEDLLRIKSGSKASKAAGRIAAEGVIGAYVAVDGKSGALVEVNCETDFVARNEDFIQFTKSLAELVTKSSIADVATLTEALLANSNENVETARKALVMKLGENINIRRLSRHETQGRIAFYLHGTRIGVLVDYTGGDEALGKDLAMHIAASKPMCVSKEQISAEILEHERQIFTAQAAESGKPSNIIEKMVEGRITKYLAEITLLGQPFVKDPEQTVEKLLTKKAAKVNDFTMFVVGEGIEKKTENFAEEVQAQMGQAK